jgi:hypothetical protein
MAVISDEFLGTILHQAAESFPVPTSGAADILRRANKPAEGDGESGASAEAAVSQIAFELGDEPTTQPALTRVRRLRTVVGTHRVLTAAAAAVVVVAVLGSTLLLGGLRPTTPRGIVSAGAPVSTTTVPNEKSAATGGHGSAALGTAPASTGSAGVPRTDLQQASGSTTNSGAFAPATPPVSAAAPTTSTGTAALPSDSVGQSARIEQTGTLDLTVPPGKLSTTIAQLTYMAGLYGGFVANSQSQLASGGTPANGSVTLQIPVASFSAALKNAQSLGKTTQLTTKATDVTGQYVNLQEQISALQASRQQYLTIMARATSIGDILSVQEQLDSIDTQIQQLQGQLGVLTSETSYSTLTVLVNEKSTSHHHPAPHPLSGLAKAWHDSVHGFTSGVDGLVRVAGPLLFILLCAGVVLVAGRLLWRRYQRHRL